MHGTMPPLPAPSVEARRGRIRRLVIVAGVILVLAIVAAAIVFRGGASSPPAGAGKPSDPPPVVSVIVPGETLVSAEVALTGSIAAKRAAPVGVSGDGGAVTAVLVKEGDFVRRGQVLATIDRQVQVQQIAQMDAGIRQAIADAALAEANLKRAQALLGRGFISKADIDQKMATRDGANAKVALARAQLGEMRARVGRLDVRSPTDGLILTRSVEAGQVVGPGSPALFTLAEGGIMELRGRAAEEDLPKVRIGMPARVRLVGSDRDYTGRVWLIDPVVDPQARQGGVRIELGRGTDFRPGAFANATVIAGSASRPLLPQSALQSDDRGNYVLIVGDDGRVTPRRVTVGTVSDAGVAIKTGLSGREKVVASAGAFLNAGERVKPVLRSATQG